MLHYPKIADSSKFPCDRCIAFEKYDGTNLHWDWDRDFGWHAFGTRRDSFNLNEQGIRAFHEAHPGLKECVEVFLATLAEGLEAVFRQERYTQYPEMKAFAEFLGPSSFAGSHQPDDPKELVLFDVEAAGFGMVGPEEFVADFGHLPSARVVYRGKFTGNLTEKVRRGDFGVAEGVVIKGGTGGELWMCKVKTDAYKARLQAAFHDRWADFWE